MRISALEKVALDTLFKWKSNISNYDRGVILGFLFSLLPLLPVALFGVLLGAGNYLLWRRGRLEVFEGWLIKMGLLLGLINIALSILLLTSLIGLLEGIPLELYVKWLNEKVLNAFHWFYQLRTTKGVTAL